MWIKFMKLFPFFAIAPLWSVYVKDSSSTRFPPKQHIVMPDFVEPRHWLFQALSIPPHECNNWHVIDFSTSMSVLEEEEEDVTHLPLLSIAHLPDTNSDIRQRHRPPSFHHSSTFDQSPYAKVMSYPEFCRLEEKVARIVFAYLGDTHHHWMLQLDPLFLYSDSVKRYAPDSSTVHRTFWITPSATMGVPDAIVLETSTLSSRIG